MNSLNRLKISFLALVIVTICDTLKGLFVDEQLTNGLQEFRTYSVQTSLFVYLQSEEIEGVNFNMFFLLVCNKQTSHGIAKGLCVLSFQNLTSVTLKINGKQTYFYKLPYLG